MAIFNELFSVPNDGTYHAVATVGAKNLNSWFELSVEVGACRVALSDKDEQPNAGHLVLTDEQYVMPREGDGYVMVKAEGGVVSGVICGTGEAL